MLMANFISYVFIIMVNLKNDFLLPDRQRLLEGEHSINQKPITVKLQPPKKKVPPDPLRIHVQGLSEKTTEDCLCFYLEKFSGVDVEKVYFGANNNALVVFDCEPGMLHIVYFSETSYVCKSKEIFVIRFFFLVDTYIHLLNTFLSEAFQ